MSTAIAAHPSPPVAYSKVTQRISALDFTKGSLVLFMVLYHWLNYFIGSEGVIYRYLRFLPPSFILITGFLISNAYLSKYSHSDPRLPKRLASRALKVLAMFVILNLAIEVLRRKMGLFSGQELVSSFISGNIVGEGVGKSVAFHILIPIAYLLMLAAVVVPVSGSSKRIFCGMWVTSLLAILLLHMHGLQSVNLELMAIGLLGLLIGYCPVKKVNEVVGYRAALVVAYGCYLGIITWREPSYPVQVIGVCLTLALIYVVGLSDRGPSSLRRVVVVLGKYSLLGYIGQVAILQALRWICGRHERGPAGLFVSFVIALLATLVLVLVVERWRQSSETFDGFYKAVFA
jgi:peptidoglycan/LPS O-acetylase OafA/YrhL